MKIAVFTKYAEGSRRLGKAPAEMEKRINTQDNTEPAVSVAENWIDAD